MCFHFPPDGHQYESYTRVDGRAIRLQLQTDRIGALGASLEELRNLGAKIAGELRQEANITASMSSRMLFGANN